MGKSRRNVGIRCALMPGEVFTSEIAADDARVTRQINVVTGGMGQANYVVMQCRCRRYHVMLETHLEQWNSRRREKQRERKRNA